MTRNGFLGAVLAAVLFAACGGEGEADASPPADANGGPDVVMVGMGEALVTWNAPTTRSDGTDLAATSLAGYRVHYGTSSGSYGTTLDVGMSDSATVTGLEAGRTYYFAVTAYDLADRESAYSEEATKVL